MRLNILMHIQLQRNSLYCIFLSVKLMPNQIYSAKAPLAQHFYYTELTSESVVVKIVV